MDTNSDQLISDARSGAAPEVIPPGEAAAIQQCISLIEKQVSTQAASSPPAKRDAHPKAHGCVQAQFRVLDNLPPAYRHGVFAQPHTYKAWIRFSSSNGMPQPDSIGDGRGMAVKLVGVEGSPSGTQDFVSVSHPVFLVRNVVDYAELQSKIDNPMHFFMPSWDPLQWRIHEAIIAFTIKAQKASNVLDVSFFSMSPYMLGETPCKFCMRPVGDHSEFNDRTGDNFLRDNLVKALADSDAAFDFCIQLRTKPDAMPIEDPTIQWPESDSPFVPVARITIPRQIFDTPAQNQFAENLSFTPWHGLEAHRPLGGLNRVRRVVYQAISKLRHGLNHQPRVEPGPDTMP